MSKPVRFGDYLHEINVNSREISYAALMPHPRHDANGKEIPIKPAKLTLKANDIYRLLQPYFSVRFIEQARAVIPLAAYLGLFQWLVLRQRVSDAAVIALGLAAVMLGLMLFMEGLKLGMMPFGEVIGNSLPRKLKLPFVLAITFALGVGVTFAEPAIGALQVAGSIVDPEQAPYLYALLGEQSWATVLIVGAGVGLAAVLGTLRFIYGWSLKPLIYASVLPTLAISAWAHTNPDLISIIGLAWDCGGVTTGPVTVPLVLALGIGVASAAGKGESSLAGFGIVTLASVLPVLGVMLLGIGIAEYLPKEAISASAQAMAANAKISTLHWSERTPFVEVILGIRAIVPLVVFLMLVLSFVIKEKLSNVGIIRYGIALTIVGMVLFNLGLTYGLAKLGDQSGSLVPSAFTAVQQVTGSPLFNPAIGIAIALIFAWLLGFGATLAEPALNALGITVENLTNGAFKKSLLMYAVSFGVATGIALGIAKIIFNFPIMYILIPGYAIALLLTFLSNEEFVNVGWDSAGVTTGPVTVPLVLAIGLSFGKAVGATEGFGILAAASVCPIIAVLAMGLYAERQANKKRNTNQDQDQEDLELNKVGGIAA